MVELKQLIKRAYRAIGLRIAGAVLLSAMLFLAGILALYQLAYAAPRDLDTSFATSGKVTAKLPALANGYLNTRAITIDNTKVPGATDLSNFPMVFSGTFSYLKTTGNGGKVTNSSGFDIIFTSDSAGNTKLDHQIESYDASTGEVNFWVRIPTLGATADTTIYLFYGNSSVSTTQENATGVWASHFKAVWNLKESGNGTAAEFKDSTSNANHGRGGDGTSGQVPTQATDKTGKGQDFDGSDDYIAIPSATSLNPTSITISGWMKSDIATPEGGAALAAKGTGGGGEVWSLDLGGANSTPRIFFRKGGDAFACSAATSLTQNQFGHVAGTYDGSNLKIYVNGALSTTCSAAQGDLDTNTHVVSIGSRQGGTTTYDLNFDGVIDQVHISKYRTLVRLDHD